MTFSEFLHILHSIIDNGDTDVRFTKTMLDLIIDQKHFEIVTNLKPKTVASYYYGNRGISRVVKKMQPYLNFKEFKKYIFRY